MGRSALSLLFVAAVVAAAVAGAAASHDGIESLSSINVTGASILMDSAVSIHASPEVLGEHGEDSAWVTVNFSSTKPLEKVLIAVFSPSNFNGDVCPNHKGEKPIICTAPIKYRDNISVNGTGNTTFLLINQRYDFAFGLFTGGKDNPKLVAVSNKISFANPKAPVYPRLAQGKAWNEMTVTWTSGYNLDEAYPFVECRTKGEEHPKRSPADTLTFTQWHMCGEPARSIGYRDPGFIHTAFLEDLWPNKEYVYQIGHELLNGTIVWGKPYSFRASPYPGQNSLQRIIVFGDMGKGERDGSSEYANRQPGALRTTDQLIKDLPNYDIVFHIGDLSYANGYISQWDQFTAQVEPIASAKAYMVASGNHERDWPNSASFFDKEDSGGECGVPAETYFYVPAENRAKFWYSTDYGMFRFCVADTEHDWRPGTEQYKFLERCFATVDRKKQPWLIFLAHRPLGYSATYRYASRGSFAEPMGRMLQKLWQNYRVDLAIYGHVHSYQRSCPAYENTCTTSEKNRYSGTMNGTIHVVAGNGGFQLVDTSYGTGQWWSIRQDKDFGYVKLTASNYSSLLFEYKHSWDGKTQDWFTINRDYRDVLSCVVDSCPTHTLAG